MGAAEPAAPAVARQSWLDAVQYTWPAPSAVMLNAACGPASAIGPFEPQPPAGHCMMPSLSDQ
jgi:hypothetical protein